MDTFCRSTLFLILPILLFFTACGEETPAGPSSVTLCTYNVEDFNLSNDSYNKIAACVYNNGIDLIALQEVQPGDHPNDPTKWNDPNNAGDQGAFHTALQTAGSPMPSSEFSSDGGLTYLYGDYLAFFSKYPLNATASILKGDYTDPVSGQSFSMSSLRPVLYTTTRFAGRTLHLFNLHLKAQGFPSESYPDDIKKRRAQAHALENHIKSNLNPVSDLIVILGDANTALTNADTQGGDDFLEASTLGMLCLKSDNPGNTANDFTPMNVTLLPENSWTHSVYTSRLDHIILSRAAYALYRPGSIRIVSHPPGDPSDHLPVKLTLDAP